jgi:hypothetical protein
MINRSNILSLAEKIDYFGLVVNQYKVSALLVEQILQDELRLFGT